MMLPVAGSPLKSHRLVSVCVACASMPDGHSSMGSSLQKQVWAGFVNKGINKVCVEEWVKEQSGRIVLPCKQIYCSTLERVVRSLTAIVFL